MKNLCTIIVSLLMLAAGVACADNHEGMDADLGSPQATVLAYCHNGIFNLGLKYFHYPEDRVSTSETAKLNWSNCKVINSHKLDHIGEIYDGTKVEEGDVQVILKLDAKDNSGKIYSQTYSFFLHKYSLGWQIYSYSAAGAD